MHITMHLRPPRRHILSIWRMRKLGRGMVFVLILIYIYIDIKKIKGTTSERRRGLRAEAISQGRSSNAENMSIAPPKMHGSMHSHPTQGFALRFKSTPRLGAVLRSARQRRPLGYDHESKGENLGIESALNKGPLCGRAEATRTIEQKQKKTTL